MLKHSAFALFLGAWLLASSSPGATNRHVILITMDGFAAYLLTDPQAPIPTLRRLAREGVSAEGMRVSNPSVTWPNHTTLVTGVHPEKHSVLSTACWCDQVQVCPCEWMASETSPN